MSPVDEYKKLEKRFVARCRTVCRNAAAGAHELFSILFSRGRQRFTVMFIPHSEKRSFSFKLSFFLLLFIVVLTIGVTSSFVYLAVRQGGNNRLLAEKTSALKKNEADLELLRDEIAEISQTSGVFQLALKNAVSALEMAGADDFTAEGGGFSSFYEFNDEDQGGLAELGELQSLRALLEQSTDEMDTTTRLLVSVNNLLVQLPTLWPLEGVHGRLMTLFGPAIHPFTGQRYLHKGIDIAYSRGTPIIAAAGGTVIERGYEAFNYGNYIKIQHSFGFYTKYGHMDRVFVEEGDTVAQGERIGTLGSTGLSTGPHLHFEIYLGNQVLDPLRYLNIQTDLEEEQ